MSRKHRKVFTNLNYIERLLILAFSITGCISISRFDSLIGIRRNYEFCNRVKIYAITSDYKSIIKKKKGNEIVLIAKSILNRVEVIISKALTD